MYTDLLKEKDSFIVGLIENWQTTYSLSIEDITMFDIRMIADDASTEFRREIKASYVFKIIEFYLLSKGQP